MGGAQAHISVDVIIYFRKKVYQQMNKAQETNIWPPRSPEYTPMDSLWDYINKVKIVKTNQRIGDVLEIITLLNVRYYGKKSIWPIVEIVIVVYYFSNSFSHRIRNFFLLEVLLKHRPFGLIELKMQNWMILDR